MFNGQITLVLGQAAHYKSGHLSLGITLRDELVVPLIYVRLRDLLCLLLEPMQHVDGMFELCDWMTRHER